LFPCVAKKPQRLSVDRGLRRAQDLAGVDHDGLAGRAGPGVCAAPDPQYASGKYWEQMARDLRPVYTAPTEQAAAARFEEFADTWGGQ
jgi:hypothetical protein